MIQLRGDEANGAYIVDQINLEKHAVAIYIFLRGDNNFTGWIFLKLCTIDAQWQYMAMYVAFDFDVNWQRMAIYGK